MNVLEQIDKQYDRLSKKQQQIAEYIRQHTNTCCFASLKEIAAATGTTEIRPSRRKTSGRCGARETNRP